MPQTPNFNIRYPDGPTSYTPLQQHFSNLALDVDNALQNGLGGAPRIANSDAERNTIYPAPVQGNTVVRPDRGWTEQYFGAYNSGTNPAGATTAGWYPVSGRMPRLSRRRESTALSTAAANADSPFNLPTSVGNDTPSITYVASTGVVTCTIPGWYQVSGVARWQQTANDAGRRIVKGNVGGLTTYNWESSVTNVGGAYGTSVVFNWMMPVPANGTITVALNPSGAVNWFGDLNVLYVQPL